MSSRRIAESAAWVLGAGLFFLCGPGCIKDTGVGDQTSKCGVDFSCSDGDVCESDGRCYGTPSAPESLLFEVVPPRTRSLVTQEFASATIQDGRIVLQLDEPRKLTGTVTAGKDAVS